jgi:hypothetical protein
MADNSIYFVYNLKVGNVFEITHFYGTAGVYCIYWEIPPSQEKIIRQCHSGGKMKRRWIKKRKMCRQK